MTDEMNNAIADLENFVEGDERMMKICAATAILDYLRQQEAEHQARVEREAEEGLAWDRKWLLSVGFEQDADRDYVRILTVADPYPTFLALCVDSTTECTQACIMEYETMEDSKKFDKDQFSVISVPGTIKTRGQVARLCSALGIPLNAKSPKEGGK